MKQKTALKLDRLNRVFNYTHTESAGSSTVSKMPLPLRSRFTKSPGIASQLIILVASLVVFVSIDNLIGYRIQYKRLRLEKEIQIRKLVESAHSLVNYFYLEASEGRTSPEEAKLQAIRTLRHLRFDGLGYFWIHDHGLPVPRMVLNPLAPELEGKVLDQPTFNQPITIRKGPKGNSVISDALNLFVAMNESIGVTHEGFVEYEWPKPLLGGGTTAISYLKLSYLKNFEPWGWIIGSGIYIDDLDSYNRHDIEIQLIIAFLWLIFLIVFIRMIVFGIIRPVAAFSVAIDKLRKDPESEIGLPIVQPNEIGILADSFMDLMADLKQSRNDLRITIDRLRLDEKALENMSEGVLITDAARRIVKVNPAFTKISGYSEEEMLGHTPRHLQSGKHRIEFYRSMWERIKTSGTWSGIVWNRKKNGQEYPQQLSISIMVDSSGKLKNYVGVLSDITERRIMQEKIRFLAELSDVSPATINVHDVDGNYLYANQKTFDLHGYTEEQFRSLSLRKISTPATAELIASRLQTLREKSEITFQVDHFRKDGSIIPLEVIVKRISWEGREAFLSVGTDISERKKADAEIRAALVEKELLIRELYHRSNNNMQLIIALLAFQSEATGDERLSRIISSTQVRITSLALINGRLFEAKDLSHINLKDYILDLASLLAESHGGRGEPPRLVTDLEDVWVLVDTAVPCGLILTELISNVYRHAYPEGQVGTLEIDLKIDDDKMICVKVADRGTGVPAGFDLMKTNHVGIPMIVNFCSSQLHSTVRFDAVPGGGIACEFCFRDDIYKVRV